MRVATVAERVRSTGRYGYLMSLGLSDRALLDAVGNHFDPDALIVCVMRPLFAWANGDRWRHEFPSPRRLMESFRRVREWVEREGEVTVTTHPFPEDLRQSLMHEAGRTIVSGASTAGDGRGDG